MAHTYDQLETNDLPLGPENIEQDLLKCSIDGTSRLRDTCAIQVNQLRFMQPAEDFFL